MHEGAEGVDVGPGVDLLGPDLLGRHVEGRADDDAVRARPPLIAAPQRGQAEVEDLDEVATVARGGDEDVLRLEIAVHDPLVVRLGEGVADLGEEGGGARPGQGAAAPQEGRQVLASQVLHHHVQRAFGFAEVEHLDGVRVGEERHGLGLPLEAPDDVAVGDQGGVQHLEGGDLAHDHVLDLVDHAHAASADPVEDAVAGADDAAEHGVRSCAPWGGRDLRGDREGLGLIGLGGRGGAETLQVGAAAPTIVRRFVGEGGLAAGAGDHRARSCLARSNTSRILGETVAASSVALGSCWSISWNSLSASSSTPSAT